MPKRLIVDMDGVLADVYSQYLHFEESETGVRRTIERMNGITEEEAFKNIRNYVFSKGFFRNAPVIQGSVRALEILNRKYGIVLRFMVIHSGKLLEKHEWLLENFPFITWQQMVFCGLKSAVYGDAMIHYCFKNLDFFKGKTFLFTQPHNTGLPEKKHTRVNSWEEILTLL